ncbi:DUF3800 domain-containing protein [Leifsonia sp. CL154]|uniref:DUF3800 domain-containing protein n=1 Tax=Leifsonia sp. CL154 TaxID=1798214 RepID=UPI0034A54B14
MPGLLTRQHCARPDKSRASLLLTDQGPELYLLFVDESGTHGGADPFVLGGIAIHEDDAAVLQAHLDKLVIKHLGRVPVNLEEYEIHAHELRNAKKPKVPGGRSSIWSNVPRSVRAALLADAYDLLADFRGSNSELGPALFGVAVEKNFHSEWSVLEHERFAYEVLLGKFDVMLKTLRVRRKQPNRGLVIHDRRVVAEQDIQSWTSSWRSTAERIGQLRNLADVPLFTDSRATRLIQAADIISYAVFRSYASRDSTMFDRIWPAFHPENGVTHGCVHYTPSYGQGSCECRPCEQRLSAEAVKSVARPRRRTERRQ